MDEIPLNPRAAAAVFMEQCHNNVEQAKSLARTQLEESRYAELRTVLWHTAIDGEIDQLWRSGRGIRKREVEHPSPAPAYRAPTPAASPTRPLAKGETSVPGRPMMEALDRRVAGLMHFEMPNGTHLGDWTKRNLVEHGRKIVAAGKSATMTGMWMIAIADMLPKDASVVREVLVEADLQRLFRRQQALMA